MLQFARNVTDFDRGLQCQHHGGLALAHFSGTYALLKGCTLLESSLYRTISAAGEKSLYFLVLNTTMVNLLSECQVLFGKETHFSPRTKDGADATTREYTGVVRSGGLPTTRHALYCMWHKKTSNRQSAQDVHFLLCYVYIGTIVGLNLERNWFGTKKS